MPHAHPRRSGFCAGDGQQRIRRPPHLVSAGEPFSIESRLAVGGALNAELAHPVAKGVGMEIRRLRGALWPIHPSISLLQGGQDTAFHPAHRRLIAEKVSTLWIAAKDFLRRGIEYEPDSLLATP
jgi:hypothetical protein